LLRQKALRRTIGAVFVLAGGALMWFAPASTFVPQSAIGVALLVAGIVLEAFGIALEHRDPNGESEGKGR